MGCKCGTTDNSRSTMTSIVSDELHNQNANIEKNEAERTVILHVKGCWSVVILYPDTIVQKSVQNGNKKVSSTDFCGVSHAADIGPKNAIQRTKWHKSVKIQLTECFQPPFLPCWHRHLEACSAWCSA